MFTWMVEPAQERIYRMALRITRNTEDAEDARQETLLKGYRKLGQFEGRSHFNTWISRIAINEALMCLRKRRPVVTISLEEAMQPTEEASPGYDWQCPMESPEAACLRKELRDSLARAIANLRPSYRAVFVMRTLENLSTMATAKALRISASAVKARMSRARTTLRKLLQESWTSSCAN